MAGLRRSARSHVVGEQLQWGWIVVEDLQLHVAVGQASLPRLGYGLAAQAAGDRQARVGRLPGCHQVAFGVAVHAVAVAAAGFQDGRVGVGAPDGAAPSPVSLPLGPCGLVGCGQGSLGPLELGIQVVEELAGVQRVRCRVPGPAGLY